MDLVLLVGVDVRDAVLDGADPVVGLVADVEAAVGADREAADEPEEAVHGEVVVRVEAVAARLLAVTLGVPARGHADAPVRADHGDAVDAARVALGDVELAGGREGECLGRGERGVGGEVGEVAGAGPRAVQRPARHHLEAALGGHLHHDVVVDEVDAVVQGVDRQLGGPAQRGLLQAERALAGERLPVVVLEVGLDQGPDGARARVQEPHRGPVREVDVPLAGHRHPLGVDEPGLGRGPPVPAPRLVPRQTPLPAAGQQPPVVVHVRGRRGVRDLEDAVGLGVRDVERAGAGVHGQVVAVRHAGRVEAQQGAHLALRVDLADQVEVAEVEGAVRGRGDGEGREQRLSARGSIAPPALRRAPAAVPHGGVDQGGRLLQVGVGPVTLVQDTLLEIKYFPSVLKIFDSIKNIYLEVVAVVDVQVPAANVADTEVLARDPCRLQIFFV